MTSGQELAAINSPIGHVLLPTAVSLVVVTLFAVIRWLMNQAAWAYHPRGAGGFLVDEIVRIAVIFLPFIFVGIGIRYYFFVLHPELKNSPLMFSSLLLILVARVILRRLPVVRAVARHIDAAKAQARAAKEAKVA